MRYTTSQVKTGYIGNDGYSYSIIDTITGVTVWNYRVELSTQENHIESINKMNFWKDELERENQYYTTFLNQY